MKKKIALIIAGLVLVAVIIFAAFNAKGYIYDNQAKKIFQAAEALFEHQDYPGAIKAYEKLLSGFPKSGFAAKTEFHLAEAHSISGRLLKARDIYRELLSQNLDLDFAKTVYERLGDLNIKILFSPAKTLDSIVHKVQDNDTLGGIAKKYNTTVELIKKANNLKTDVIRSGADLKIATANFSIVVDKSQNTLTLKSGEEVVKIYAVSTGANNVTPVGSFKITNKIVDPPWFSDGKAILPGDPKNILGSRWLGLTQKGYGIHGTTDDASIGTQCTEGCVRMHNRDVEELYDIVPVGTEVTIVD